MHSLLSNADGQCCSMAQAWQCLQHGTGMTVLAAWHRRCRQHPATNMPAHHTRIVCPWYPKCPQEPLQEPMLAGNYQRKTSACLLQVGQNISTS